MAFNFKIQKHERMNYISKGAYPMYFIVRKYTKLSAVLCCACIMVVNVSFPERKNLSNIIVNCVRLFIVSSEYG